MATVNVEDVEGLAKVAISSHIKDLVTKPAIDGHDISWDTTSAELGLAKTKDVPSITDDDWEQMQALVERSMQQGDKLLDHLRLGGTSTGAIWNEDNTAEAFGLDEAGNAVIMGIPGRVAKIRGSETRPYYNGKELGLLSDLVTGGVPLKARSAYDCDKCYDTGVYSIQYGTNTPTGTTDSNGGYGTLLVMGYRNHSGNEKTDFCTQLLIPPGNKITDAMFFRTSKADGWNSWQELSGGFGGTSTVNIGIADADGTKASPIRTHINDFDVGTAFNTVKTNRCHIVFSSYFKAGTKICFLISSSATWDYAWAVEMAATPEKYTSGDRRIADSGWVTSETSGAGTMGVTGFEGFSYVVTTLAGVKFVALTTPCDGFIGITVKGASDDIDFSTSANRTAFLNFVIDHFGISGKGKAVACIKGADSLLPRDINPNFRTINHKGYHSGIPENTLSAFRESKNRGFKYVECDVQMTSDGKYVIIHDDTINRTARHSDGSELTNTYYVKDCTYEFLYSLNFSNGLSAYLGEKIPTLKQFIMLCKNLGLHPYVEIKKGAFDDKDDQLVDMVKMVRRMGMLGKMTWISFDAHYLATILSVDQKSRFGYIISNSTNGVTADAINTAFADSSEMVKAGIKNTDYFVDAQAYYTDDDGNTVYPITADIRAACINNGAGLEVWTVDSIEVAEELPEYVTGFTTNTMHFDSAFASSAGFYPD